MYSSTVTITVPGGRIDSLFNVLASHNTHIVSVNFIREWRDLQLDVKSERQILDKLFMIDLFTLRDFASKLLRANIRKNI